MLQRSSHLQVGSNRNDFEPISEEMTMKENVTNRLDAEEALDAELIEERVNTAPPDELKTDGTIDTSPLPKGMRERVETVEVSTLTPKG
jgi:hypothetical protein